jgi:hypothetical protein
MPSWVDFQKASVPTPLGAMTPMPVTTVFRACRELIVSSHVVGS